MVFRFKDELKSMLLDYLELLNFQFDLAWLCLVCEKKSFYIL